MEQIVYGNLRVQFLSEDIVRIERAEKGGFCDRDTFFIPDRAQYADTHIGYSQEENVVCFGEYELYLPENGRSLSGVKLEKNGRRVYAYRRQKNSGELPPLDQTPEVFAAVDCPRILIPEGGYSAERKGEYIVEENAQDVYLLLCGKDYKKLRRLYVELTGRSELVRLSTLGGWNSKYYAYTEEEAKQLILDYEKHDVPLDNMVIDTDWRDCADGWGYDINTKLFPDMKRFLDFAHAHGVEVMFNDHPEPVEGAHVFEGKEIAYREEKLQSLMGLGLDTWWYDRNWSTSLISPTRNIRHETFGLYLFSEITKHFYQKQSDGKVYRRPVIMGNVVNIANGCYQGISDSASHRYSIQWTGDIPSDPDSLAQEIASMIRATNNGVAYCNADCGGHIGDPDKEVFLRWMQFGTLSPVFRPHCTNTVRRNRDPWAYDEETLRIVREYNKLRYRLLPVIYRGAYESYMRGEPIFKALGWNYPADKKALRCTDEYMLGSNILIKPIAGRNPAPVARGNYTKPVKATYFNGTQLQGAPIATAEYRKLDMVLCHTSPEKGVPVYNFSARFETELKFEKDVELIVRCDDGATVWIDGEKVFEDKTLHSAMTFPLKVIEGGKSHNVEIEYFQAGGEAAIGLYYCEAKNDDSTGVYLPAGKWLDVFDGKIYAGGKTIRKQYSLREMPLFVRLGALVPLAYEARNTKEQKWNKLVFDFYPDKDGADEGYLYEDDGETTAYKFGQFRKSGYAARFEQGENAYVITMSAAEGAFAGERACHERDITIKYHCLKDVGMVRRVTVNGEEVPFKRTKREAGAFPLDTSLSAPDAYVVGVSFLADVAKEQSVVFFCE